MRLAVIPGDGIGPEVVAEGLKVLREVVPDVETTPYDLGAARWQRTGELLNAASAGDRRPATAADQRAAMRETRTPGRRVEASRGF